MLVVGQGKPPVLTPDQRARFEAADKALDESLMVLTVDGKFQEPEDDPDGFDRRMSGV